MMAWLHPILRASIAFALVSGGPWALSADPRPEPRPIAREQPAFRAPEDIPEDEVPEHPIVAEAAGPLVLEDALALALMHSPELAVFSWDVRAAEARALQAGKPPNPELDLRLYRLGIPRARIDPDEARYRVMLSQVFEFGAKGRKRHDLAQTERDLAGWEYESKRIEIATSVAAQFAAVLGAQQRVDSTRQAAGFFDTMSERISTLVEQGAVRRLELHSIARRAGLARIDLHAAESKLATARFRMAAIWGSQSPLFTEAVGDLEQLEPIPDLTTVLDLAEQSPAIARWDAEHARGEAALSLAKAGRVPDVNAGAGIRWEEDFSEKDYIFDLEIELPLLDRKQGDIREARYRMARAQAGRKAAEASGSELIAEFYNRVTEATLRSTTLSREVLPAARASFDAQRLGFERTADKLDDLLDARRDLARAEIQYTEALVDYHEALSVLEGLVGQALTNPD